MKTSLLSLCSLPFNICPPCGAGFSCSRGKTGRCLRTSTTLSWIALSRVETKPQLTSPPPPHHINSNSVFIFTAYFACSFLFGAAGCDTGTRRNRRSTWPLPRGRRCGRRRLSPWKWVAVAAVEVRGLRGGPTTTSSQSERPRRDR